MNDIRDSDSIPTSRDKEVADEILRNDSGEYDARKMASEIARLRRRDLQQSKANDKMESNQDAMAETLTSLNSDMKMFDGKLDLHISRSSSHDDAVMQCLQGDEMGMDPGLINGYKALASDVSETKDMITTLTHAVTGSGAKTDKYKKSDSILDTSLSLKSVLTLLGSIGSAIAFVTWLVVSIVYGQPA